MDRRTFQRLLLLSGLAVTGVGCASTTPLRVGLHPWPGYETLTLAEHFGWLPSRIQLSMGISAGDSMEGLHAGRLDAAALTLDEVLALRCTGMPLTVVLVFNESVGADQVIARPGLSLHGHDTPIRVALERSTVGKVVFQQWRRSLGLPMEAFDLLDIPPAEQREPWEQQAVDVAIGYAPYSRHLLQRGGEVIYDSSQFPGVILDVLAVRSERIGWRDRDLLKGLMAAHFQGLNHLRRNTEDSMRRIAVWRGLDYREVLLGYAGINQPDEPANRRMLATDDKVAAVVRVLEPLMRESGLLSNPCDFTGLTTPRFIP